MSARGSTRRHVVGSRVGPRVRFCWGAGAGEQRLDECGDVAAAGDADACGGCGEFGDRGGREPQRQGLAGAEAPAGGGLGQAEAEAPPIGVGGFERALNRFAKLDVRGEDRLSGGLVCGGAMGSEFGEQVRVDDDDHGEFLSGGAGRSGWWSAVGVRRRERGGVDAGRAGAGGVGHGRLRLVVGVWWPRRRLRISPVRCR